jgi:hypothetical protein
MVKPDQAIARAAAIRKLNDRLRLEGRGGHYRLSEHALALPYEAFVEIEKAIRAYDSFSLDPLDEHDHGIVVAHGEAYVWEMDYIGKTGLESRLTQVTPL